MAEWRTDEPEVGQVAWVDTGAEPVFCFCDIKWDYNENKELKTWRNGKDELLYSEYKRWFAFNNFEVENLRSRVKELEEELTRTKVLLRVNYPRLKP